MVLLALRHHLAQVLILGLGAHPSGLACLLVGSPLRLLDQLESDGQGGFGSAIQAGQEVDALDIAVEAMIPMPANEGAFIGVEFFLNAVIEDQHGVLGLHLPYQRFDEMPSVGRGEVAARQEPRDPIMADRAVKQGRKAGRGGQAERTNQIVRVEIEKLFVHALFYREKLQIH